MNKTEFIEQVAQRLNCSKGESAKYLTASLQVLAETLNKDERIAFIGFGTFTPWQQTERIGRNPQNGKPAVIKARKSVRFKAGKDLLQHLNR